MATPPAEPGSHLLLTAWHLPRMRSLPLLLWRLRRLERHGRAHDGCWWMHRWISRRSLLLSSHWTSREAAEAWLRSPAFRAFDAQARAAGAVPHVEIADLPAPTEADARDNV